MPKRTPLHPHLARHHDARRASLQDRVADQITGFAGSMAFVYLHVAWFLFWVVFQPFHDAFPFGLLTMVVSLEAIFLGAIVMISQNRADERRQVLADHQWETVQIEEKQNEQLLELTRRVLSLTTEMHTLTTELHRRSLPSRETPP
jgi:uncharacterized membrane protein